jgi:hypothetical protein
MHCSQIFASEPTTIKEDKETGLLQKEQVQVLDSDINGRFWDS